MLKQKNMPKVLKKLYNNKGIAAVRSFMDGPFFPICLAICALTCYLLNWDLVGIALFLAVLTFVLFFSEDTRPALALALFFFLNLHYYKDSSLFVSTKAIVLYFVFGIPAACGLVFRLLAFEITKSKRKLLIGLIAMSVAFLIGGIFSEHYRIYNLIKALGLMLSFCVAYLIFSLTMRHREDNVLYISRLCAIAVCCIAIQLLEIYIKLYEWGSPLDSTWKDKIVLGWGISNSVGELVAFFLPAIFYLIYKQKFGYVYYFIVLIAFLTIFFTLSRNALLFGTCVLLVGCVISCCIGQNKKIHRIIVPIMFITVAGTGLLLLQSSKFDNLFSFFTNNKLNDRGRFELWEKYMNLFKDEPIFGVGFVAYRNACLTPAQIEAQVAWHAHNTIIQVLSGSGIVGLALYLFHRVQTILLLVKKPKAERLFLGGCVIVGLLQSLLSPFFFRMYFAVFCSIMLLIIEQSYEADCEKEKQTKIQEQEQEKPQELTKE